MADSTRLRFMAGSASPSNPAPNFGVVILAAGKSARMGRPKLLLPWGDTSILGHLLRAWAIAGANQLAPVVAPQDTVIAAELDRLGVPLRDRIPNTEPERGMFSSIQCAARWAGWRGDLTHFVITLGDQPHLRPATLRGLLEFSAGNPEVICQPSLRGRPRHPVVLPKVDFGQLAAAPHFAFHEFLEGRKSETCAFEDPGLELDIDTPEDYRRALALR
jgi:molybdenum cofactor cytidylyltransferase